MQLGPEAVIAEEVMLVAEPPKGDWADDEPVSGSHIYALYSCMIVLMGVL